MKIQALWDHHHLYVFSLFPSAPDTTSADDSACDHSQLQDHCSTLSNELLISSAEPAAIRLHLPSPHGDPPMLHAPSLRFNPGDAVEFLWQVHERLDRPTIADSLRFWAKAGQLVRHILAKQMFFPSINRHNAHCRAEWRPALDEHATRVAEALAFAMPAVCRCFAEPPLQSQPQDLIESFILQTTDASIRRAIAGDDLTHVLIRSATPGSPLQTRWLKALVDADPTVDASQPEGQELISTINAWTQRLFPSAPSREFKTSLTIQPPQDSQDPPFQGLWKLSIDLISLKDAGQVIPAAQLLTRLHQRPRLLLQSLELALPLLRQDLQRAARFFSPLTPCAQADGPLELWLSLSEAYAFLRDAAPVLRSEGFDVVTPQWWTENLRPRMRLSLQPQRETAGAALIPIHRDDLFHYDWRVAVGDDDLTEDELLALAKAKQPLVRIRDRWIEVAPEEIQAACRFIQQHGAGSATLLDVLALCHAADEAEIGLSFGGIRAAGWLESFLDAAQAQLKIEPVPTPTAFHGQLRPYQQRGLSWLAFLTRLGLGACLADDMGLGKTIQLIVLLLHEREAQKSPGPTLLICPMSLVGNWTREIQRFAPSLRVMIHHGLERLEGDPFARQAKQCDIVISTYSLVHKDFEHLQSVLWHRVALDEAQCIKNPSAKQAHAVRNLPARLRLALTGTPIENRLSELWSIIDFLNPGYLGNVTEFRRRFALPIERYQDAGRANQLRTLIRPFVLRRLKNDPLVQVDLPPKMEMRVFCNLTREQAALYQAVVNDMMRQVAQSEGIQRRGLMLATLTRLKQICNHPVHFLADRSNLNDRSGKCARLVEMLTEVIAEGDSALVFTQYKEMGDILLQLLEPQLDAQVLFLHGGTDRSRRDQLVAQFQTQARPSVFILSLKAGGFGLNLTAAAHVFHFDRWWNPAVEDQATDRAHRIGQTRTVQVHKFVCIGTLEERIDALLQQKRQLADAIIGSGESWLADLSTQEFRELITLSHEAVSDE